MKNFHSSLVSSPGSEAYGSRSVRLSLFCSITLLWCWNVRVGEALISEHPWLKEAETWKNVVGMKNSGRCWESSNGSPSEYNIMYVWSGSCSTFLEFIEFNEGIDYIYELSVKTMLNYLGFNAAWYSTCPITTVHDHIFFGRLELEQRKKNYLKFRNVKKRSYSMVAHMTRPRMRLRGNTSPFLGMSTSR